MQVVENVALISINATLVVQLVSFLIFMMVLNRMMIRPLRTIMSERQSYIQKVGQDLVAAGEAFDRISEQIGSQEQEARQTGFRIREEIVSDGRESVTALLAETKQEINTLRSEAQADAERQIAGARESMQAEAEALSDRMVNALLEPKGMS